MGKAYVDVSKEIIDFIRTNNIYWSCDLFEYAETNKSWIQFMMSKDGCRMLSAYLASKARKDGLIGDGEFHRQIDDIMSDD